MTKLKHRICVGIAMWMVTTVLAPAWSAQAADEAKTRAPFKRYVETGVRYGQDRHLNLSEIWQPLVQRDDQVLYANLRSMVDSLDNFEGNLGLGYRRFYGDHIWGSYGFIDRRTTALGSDFWQVTAGAEYIEQTWEARANIYIPTSGARTYQDNAPSGPYVAGTGVYVRQAGEVVEEAQMGLDAEVGFRLPTTQDFLSKIRLYGGGYYFRGDKTDEVIGARARIEADVTSWLQIGGRVQYDEDRGGQYLAEMTMRWPRPNRAYAQTLWGRMQDTPERDVDIITGMAVQPGAETPVIDTVTGAPLRILYVDNTAVGGGDGSMENPYNNLAAAIASASTHDIVYVAKGDGTANAYDQGYALNTSHVTLMGAGSPLTLDGARYQASGASWQGDLLVRAADDYPLIGNAGGDGLTITAPQITVRGVQVDGAAGHGVMVGAGADEITLDNVVITGNNGNGLYVNQTAGATIDVRVRNSVITGNLLSGVRTETSGGAINLDLGQAGDFGFNDIFGNIGNEVRAQSGGASTPARGNFWGGAALADIGGADLAGIDASTYVTTSFCNDCGVTLAAFTDLTGMAEGARITTAAQTASGFRGGRYVQVQGEGAPTWVINNVDTNASITKVTAGDQLAVEMTPSNTGLDSHDVTMTGGGLDDAFSAQTRFLPSAYNNLIGWWDGRDLDGDYETTDNPVGGTLLSSWVDKTGLGHDASASGGARPIYQVAAGLVGVDDADDRMSVANSFYLSALNKGATIAMVLRGVPIGPNADVFSYGTCTGLASSRCFSLAQDGPGAGMTLRIDTNTAQSQITHASGVLDNNLHLVWVQASGGGAITIRQNRADVATGTYNTGSGFWNTGGLTLAGPINGGYGEILLFNGTLGNTDRDLVEGYLATKWGL